MVKFAVFTDLHYDSIFDGDRRIEEFITKVKMEQLDFIISLGDLCYPIEKNKRIVEKLKSTGIANYYVIGNHDSEQYSQSEIMNFLQMEKPYYSFIVDDTKFIVLNACYMKSNHMNYPTYRKGKAKNCRYPVIPDSEVEWLKQEIFREDLSYVIFSHHSLANEFEQRGIANREKIQKLIESRNTLLCMNGHDHGDDCKIINNICYYTLNAMSYVWHGLKPVYPYGDTIHMKYPYLKDVILYKQAFHCFVELDKNHIKIRGMEGEYLSTTPEEVGITNRRWNGVSIQPRVSTLDRRK
ncbi:metallophosphoesterase family protein [Anaerosporobacter faecicola]|uniref:metallophosphoesterase family protein n=1 Tax=Anaerosporobacter faecicola TaxID=2718714 RepID=UPI00143B91AF|nr:metallophosphoesterase [Anaerosporobacter faecicola]